jgi:probable rRNA maturation factor
MPSRRIPDPVGRACTARHASHKGSRHRRLNHRRLDVEVLGRAPRLASWLAAVAPARARGLVTVAIVSDARVRALNRKFRKTDKATDVLSFPSEEPGYLGDVVISSGVAARQARAAGHSLATELRVLTLHGLLHLLGYDHERDDGQMARLERRLRRVGGLREGLIERA